MGWDRAAPIRTGLRGGRALRHARSAPAPSRPRMAGRCRPCPLALRAVAAQARVHAMRPTRRPAAQVEDPSKYGVVVTDDAGKVDRFVEKPKARARSSAGPPRAQHRQPGSPALAAAHHWGVPRQPPGAACFPAVTQSWGPSAAWRHSLAWSGSPVLAAARNRGAPLSACRLRHRAGAGLPCGGTA